MDEQRLDDQLESIYSGSVTIQDVACREWWTIGTSGKREWGRLILASWHDDDNDDDIYGSMDFPTFGYPTPLYMKN